MAEKVDGCGVQVEKPALVLIYRPDNEAGRRRRKRIIPLKMVDFCRRIEPDDRLERFDYELCIESLLSGKHGPLFAQLPKCQIYRLLSILEDTTLAGMSLEESVEHQRSIETMDPNEDLNKIDRFELVRKKLLMQRDYEQNEVKPTDSAFEYDKEVDFGQPQIETCDWDDDEDVSF